MSKILTDTVADHRETATSREGIFLKTDTSLLLELAGGSHSSCIVHDNGKILDAAMMRLREELFPMTGRSLRHRFQEELAQEVVQLFEEDARVYFTSGGTEAVETAIRIAHHIQYYRGRPEATIVIGREYSYHGMSLLARNVGHHPIHSALPTTIDFAWPKLPEPQCSSCPLQSDYGKCEFPCVESLQRMVEKFGRERIAAVIFEPIPGTTGGAIVPPESYVSDLYNICQREGILVIADETVTAFWRTGVSFISGPDNVDILVGGKCLAAGFSPICCVIVPARICDELQDFGVKIPLRLTFAGNPLSCLMALSVQNYIRDYSIADQVRGNGPLIGSRLQEVCNNTKKSRVNGIGHLWGIENVVKAGNGRKVLEDLRDTAAKLSVELMAGYKTGLVKDSVHILVTPPFDIENFELDLFIKAVALLVDSIEN